jgi:hypothetical protein
MAVDGGTGSFWSSGGSAPQSLEIDLGSPRTIGRVLLVARLASAGGLAATERLYGKARAEEGYVQLDEFTAPIDNGTEFERMPATPWTDVRYLKVETVVQTGDVAWREIQVFDH